MTIQEIINNNELKMYEKTAMLSVYYSFAGYQIKQKDFAEKYSYVKSVFKTLVEKGCLKEDKGIYSLGTLDFDAPEQEDKNSNVDEDFYLALAQKVRLETMDIKYKNSKVHKNCKVFVWDVSERGITFGKMAGKITKGKIRIPIKLGNETKHIYGHRLAFYLQFRKIPKIVLPIDQFAEDNYLNCDPENYNGYDPFGDCNHLYIDVLENKYLTVCRGKAHKVFDTEAEAVKYYNEELCIKLNLKPGLRSNPVWKLKEN